jgi:hypothetical protein
MALRTLMRSSACQWAGNWEPVRTSQLAQGQPSGLPRNRWPCSRNALRSDGAFLDAWHRNCPSMERSGKEPMLIMTGVGAYLAQEPRMHALATCVCAHVLSEKKGAMVYVTRNRTMEQTMRVENAACVSRLCSADMQEALAAFVAKRRPDCSRCVRERGVAPGPMRALRPSGYPVQPIGPGLSLIEPTTTRA